MNFKAAKVWLHDNYKAPFVRRADLEVETNLFSLANCLHQKQDFEFEFCQGHMNQFAFEAIRLQFLYI
jgi:hypothetical protein